MNNIDNNICLIIPCYNEAKRLKKEVFLQFCKQNKACHLLFINDGSSDNTIEVLHELKEKNDKIQIIDLKKNIGKAEAVRQGYLFALKKEYEYIGFFDADLSTPLEESLRMKKHLSDSSLLYVFGSRIAKIGSNIERKSYRHYLGRIIATMIDFHLKLKVYDTQCGAKLMKRELAELIFNEKFISKWLFDVEILSRIIHKYGRETTKSMCLELPLNEWKEIDGSKITLKDMFKIPFQLIKISLKYSVL